MAIDYEDLSDQTADIIKAVAEGGQYYQIGDKQYKRGDLGVTFKILQLAAHQQKRLTTNDGFGLATFD